MKQKYTSGTDQQGLMSPPREIPLQYAGFFGSWDSPHYRFFMYFIRVSMASIFLGLLYINALVIRESKLWSLIIGDERYLLIYAVINGITLLTLGLLSIVSYRFYRHMKREEVRLRNRSNRLTAHAQLQLQLFREIKSGLWEQFISIETKLVNSAIMNNPYHSASRYGALNFNSDQNELWCHILGLQRIFGICYKVDEDIEATALGARYMVSYKPLAKCFDELECAINDLVESGIDIHNEQILQDLICKRLVALEGLNRRAIEMIMQTEETLNSLVPKLDSISLVKKEHSKLAMDDDIFDKRIPEIDPFEEGPFLKPIEPSGERY